jgi:hypothetical protein
MPLAKFEFQHHPFGETYRITIPPLLDFSSIHIHKYIQVYILVNHETAHRYIRSVVIREKVWELLDAKAIPRADVPEIEKEKSETEETKTST